LAVNLAGFRNCLTEYTVHSLSPCYGLLTALVLLNSVAIWCNTKKWRNFTCLLCAWASEGIFPVGALVGFSKSFSKEGQKWWNLFFTTRNWENTIFSWNF